jgi:hypothetical protein
MRLFLTIEHDDGGGASPMRAYGVHSVAAVRPCACPPARRHGQWLVASWTIVNTPLLITDTSLCHKNEWMVGGGVHTPRTLLTAFSRTQSTVRQHPPLDAWASCWARWARGYGDARQRIHSVTDDGGGGAGRRRTSRRLNTLISVASFLKKHTINPVISYRKLMTFTL